MPIEYLKIGALSQQSLNFGGSNTYSGVSTSRTLMFKELERLLDTVPIDAIASDYRRAIIEENLLLKPSASTRAKTYAYLRDRFGLDPDIPVFRVLRLLWHRDDASRPVLALLVAIYRDPVLRSTTRLVLDTRVDDGLLSSDFGRVIESVFPNRLGEKTLKSTGENTTSTYKQSGHLRSGNPSIRQLVSAYPGSVTMALLLATLEGDGGMSLLHSSWVRLLDSSDEIILAQARIAASRGWLEYRQAGDVLDITFHRLLDLVGWSR